MFLNIPHISPDTNALIQMTDPNNWFLYLSRFGLRVHFDTIAGCSKKINQNKLLHKNSRPNKILARTWNSVQVRDKDTSMASFWRLYCWLWTYLITSSSFSFAYFEHREEIRLELIAVLKNQVTITHWSYKYERYKIIVTTNTNSVEKLRMWS